MEEKNALAKVLLFYKLIVDVTQTKFKLVCPFHNDVNPSLTVDLEKERWYCFGCNKSGNAFDFVKEMESKYNRLNDLKAYQKYIKILACENSSTINIRCPPIKRKSNRQAYLEAYDFYHGLKKINWYSSVSEIKEAKNYMLERGFNISALNKARAKITYQKKYNIVFPILDNGKFKGWVSRTSDLETAKFRKYLYNKGFSRATTLAGNYKDEKVVYVVEGFLDALKFRQYGVDNVVAILGWKMSKQQEQKLKNAGVKIIVSALDNDECGKKGSNYLKTRFKTVVRWQYLKCLKDCGEATEEQFRKMLDKTVKKVEELK